MRHSELVSIHGTDVQVSRLSLGTAPLGGLFKKVAESESDSVIHHALDAGINYIDTAPLYGYGVGEVRVGRGINGHRPQPTLSTKVGRLFRPGKNQEQDKYPDSDPTIEIYIDNSPHWNQKISRRELAQTGARLN